MIIGHTATLRITTPDGVVFALPLAGPLVRGLALSVDLLVVIAAMQVLQVALVPFAAFLPDIGGGIITLAGFALQIGYSIVLEGFWGGRTLGKRLFGLRVVDDRGLRLRFPQVLVRNLLRPVDALPLFYLLGGVVSFLNRHCQRLGDLAAGTVVVGSVPSTSPPDFLGKDKFNSFRAHPALEARLRQKTDPVEAAILAQALARREELSPESRLALYGDLADHFRHKVRFPEAVTIGLTEEQFLRNAADSLFRQTARRP